MSTPGDVILAARDVRKTYRLGRVDVPVLHGASLDVGRGEWIAILGASGSGKSTLLHIMGGLDQPDRDGGSVRFEDQLLFSSSRGRLNRYRNKSIGFVFQFYHLLPELNVLENTMLPALVPAKGGPVRLVSWWELGVNVLFAGLAAALFSELIPATPRWVQIAAAAGFIVSLLFAPQVRLRQMVHANGERAVELLTAFGLGHRLKHRPRELSGGERQRVAIARALMNRPAVLLADEPTGNLDEATGCEILDLIAAQHRDGLTIVMVTHDPDIAARADRVVHLHDGRVVQGETPKRRVSPPSPAQRGSV